MKPIYLVIASLFLISSGALAQSDTSGSAGGTEGHHPPPHPGQMTPTQKACFTDNGLTAPGEGAPPKERPSREVMEKVHACLKKNGMDHPWGHPHGGPGGPNGHKGPPPSSGSSSGSAG